MSYWCEVTGRGSCQIVCNRLLHLPSIKAKIQWTVGFYLSPLSLSPSLSFLSLSISPFFNFSPSPSPPSSPPPLLLMTLYHLSSSPKHTGCMQCRRDFLSIILLQLKISLNKDPHCADLRLGLGWDTDIDIRRWGRCRAAIRGVSENIIRKSYLEKLHSYHTRKRSVFGSNLHRAIRTALGGSTFVQSDAISLTGYNLDFEVLLDRSGEPIPFPLLWKYRTRENLASSIGFEPAATAATRRAQLRTVSDKLVQSMRQSEEGSTASTTTIAATTTTATTPRSSGTIDASALPRHGEHKLPFHLASDWGRKFCELPRPAARKLIIEGDGLYHFARNDRHHQLGHTVLKRKHAEMLGWEIINVSRNAAE